MESVRKQIIDLIKRSQNILIMPSAPADGDSLGSALALYLTLKKIGKNITVVSPEPVPEVLQFLPTTNVISENLETNDFIVTVDCEKAQLNTIQAKLEHNKVNFIITAKKGQFSENEVSFTHGPNKYDLIITVDTGDLIQLGRFYEDNVEMFTRIPVINIDHHASNAGFGKINFVDIMASATTEMLFALMQDLEKATAQTLIDEDVATLLLAGIITDTGSFQNANTTPKAFKAAANLIRLGARQQEIIQHVFKTKRLSTLRLWGRILTNLKVDQKHRFVWSTIARKDFDDTNSSDEETGSIIDELLTNAPGTEVVLILKERNDGLVSGSVRTTTAAVDSSEIAGLFGGGGHVQAAGFRMRNTGFAEIEKMVTAKIQAYQQQRLQHLFEAADQDHQNSDTEAQQQLKAAVASHLQEIEKIQIPQLGQTTEESASTETLKTAVEADNFAKLEQPSAQLDRTTDESFVDVVVRKAVTAEESASKEDFFNLDNGIIYKFEE